MMTQNKIMMIQLVKKVQYYIHRSLKVSSCN